MGRALNHCMFQTECIIPASYEQAKLFGQFCHILPNKIAQNFEVKWKPGLLSPCPKELTVTPWFHLGACDTAQSP